MDEALANRIGEFLRTAPFWPYAAGQIPSEIRQTPHGDALFRALCYNLTLAPLIERTREHGPFATHHPPITEVDAHIANLWSEMAAELTAIAGLARLHDLLWIRRQGADAHLHARSAAGAYVELAQGDWSEPDSSANNASHQSPPWRSIDRVKCLARAGQLGREINALEVTSQVATDASAALRQAVAAAAFPG